MACSAALADAGIEQRDLLVGATVAVLGSADGPLVVDPTHEEMKLKVGERAHYDGLLRRALFARALTSTKTSLTVTLLAFLVRSQP
jgi:hypothetical protein